MQLLRYITYPEQRYLPMDPIVATATVLTPKELELLERQAELDKLRNDLKRISLYHRTSQFGVHAGADIGLVKDVEAVRSLLREAATNSSIEVVSMQPGGRRSVQELLEAKERDEEMLGRGVRMRVLYQHTARFDVATREHAETLFTLGAEFRTTESLFSKLIIFDGETAFIPAYQEDNGAAAVIKDPTLVAFLYACFEHTWASAKEFDTRRVESDTIGEELKTEIIKMLIAGAKDDAIARRLGLSVRTCRKHIGQLMNRFGATSRFQFGYAVKDKFSDLL
ncbi:helix-turn-helix transcriptional regulator [Actinophytocola sediminis]